MQTMTNLLGKLVQAVLTVFLLITLVFFLLRVVGDPAELMVPPEAAHADVEALKERFGLNDPLWLQYLNYLSSLLRFDLGISMAQNIPVEEIVFNHIGPTLTLTAAAFVLAVPIALVLGIVAYQYQGKLGDTAITVAATLGRAIPNFWLGLMLIVVFAVSLKVFPPSGYGTVKQLILPASALAVAILADVARLTRSSMLEERRKDYVRTAYAKGAGPGRVTYVHMLRNALIPVVTIIGLRVATLISGSIIIETIFAIPGLGWLLIRAINTFDFPLIQATIIVIGVFVILTSMIVDVLYTVINPRSRTAADEA